MAPTTTTRDVPHRLQDQSPMQVERLWIEKLALTDFRSYNAGTLTCGPGPVVLLGPNGSGKTNCLEAVSLLTAGRGLRSAAFSDLIRQGTNGWAVSALMHRSGVVAQVGTGLQATGGETLSSRAARAVKIDGVNARSSGVLAVNRMLWLTPAMDGLFTGPASERRRFIDRLVLSLDPEYAVPVAVFDRAMRQRNKALETFAPAMVVESLEAQMASAGASMASSRVRVFQALQEKIHQTRDGGTSPFPWASLSLEGELEARIALEAVPRLEEWYLGQLASGRERDRAAGRTLTGPHRSDFKVSHGPKETPAKLCSTGEQKALLIGLILAQAQLVKTLNNGSAPILLLDEVAAHLDIERRTALFEALTALKSQVWMTGTDEVTFAPLRDLQTAQLFLVSNGTFTPLTRAESASEH